VVAGAAVAAALVAAVLVGDRHGDPGAGGVGGLTPQVSAGAGGAPGAPAVSPEAAVLARWDVKRGRAYARGDVPALRALYVSGSAAAARDVAVLRSYLGRGLRVRGLTMQLLAVEVREHSPDRIRLRVTDRVVGARAVSAGWSRPLPADQPTSRVVTLQRSDGGWRMRSARPVG
jgi:hypothetical protein